MGEQRIKRDWDFVLVLFENEKRCRPGRLGGAERRGRREEGSLGSSLWSVEQMALPNLQVPQPHSYRALEGEEVHQVPEQR